MKDLHFQMRTISNLISFIVIFCAYFLYGRPRITAPHIFSVRPKQGAPFHNGLGDSQLTDLPQQFG